MTRFLLKPFASNLVDVAISGDVERSNRYLKIRYSLRGDLSAIVIPVPTPARRQHDLWQTTCFEFFLGLNQAERYWEVNLSPAGDWNVYRFDGYRAGMQEESALATLPLEVQQTSHTLTVKSALNLEDLELAEQALDLAIASVIQLKSGELTYWALAHPGLEADFHRRDSFLLQLCSPHGLQDRRIDR